MLGHESNALGVISFCMPSRHDFVHLSAKLFIRNNDGFLVKSKEKTFLYEAMNEKRKIGISINDIIDQG